MDLEKLDKLFEQKQKGEISAEEYEAQKAEILATSPSQSELQQNKKGFDVFFVIGALIIFLPILLVFLAGGISGYSNAMNKFKANKTTDQITTIVTNTKILFSSQQNYAQLGNGDAETDKLLFNTGIAPAAMRKNQGDDYTLTNVYGGKITARVAAYANRDDAGAFTLEWPNVPPHTCKEIVTFKWNSAEFMALQVSDNMAFTDMLTETTAADCKTGLYGKNFVACAQDYSERLRQDMADKWCNNAQNTILFKFK